MGKVLPSLVFAAAVFGAIVAVVVSGPAVAVVPLVGVAAAVWFLMLRHRSGYVAGGALLVFCLVALLMSVGGVSFRGGTGVGDTADTTGHAMAIASAVVACGALLGVAWGRLEPIWMPYAWLVVVLAAFGLAFGLGGDYGNPAAGANYATGLLVLLSGVPALLMLVRGEDVD